MTEAQFSAGDRVQVAGPHPWNSYVGVIVGEWPTREYDWLVRLDNGQLIGADDANHLVEAPS